MLLMSSRQKFGLPLMQLNYMAGQCLGFIARMAEVQGEEFWVDGIPFTGKDFEGNYDFEVNFLAKDEASQMRQTAQSLELYKAGAKSLEQLIEDSGESDVTGELRRIMIGKMRNDPALLKQIQGLAMQIVQKKRGITLLPETPAPAPQPPGEAGPPWPIPGQQPQPFVAQPGGPQEATQVQRGMEQIPGEGMERAI